MIYENSASGIRAATALLQSKSHKWQVSAQSINSTFHLVVPVQIVPVWLLPELQGLEEWRAQKQPEHMQCISLAL